MLLRYFVNPPVQPGLPSRSKLQHFTEIALRFRLPALKHSRQSSVAISQSETRIDFDGFVKIGSRRV